MSKLRKIPSVDSLINTAAANDLIQKYGRNQTLLSIRKILENYRNHLSDFEVPISSELIMDRSREQLEETFKTTLLPVINATGVILHTNLGRAPLSQDTLNAMQIVGTSYSTLEFDLPRGKRGSRSMHVEQILCQLTGAESAFIVNNNASAILLVLSGLASRKRVIISRTQLIEIGGGFRIPDVLKRSGAKLVEIGATNQVHIYDYSEALLEPTSLVMHAHHSNFRIVGFASEPDIKEICKISHQHGVPVLDDLGSGTFIDTSLYGLPHEPTITESLLAGSDIVTFSGDKLLGGPQAGIILGRKNLIEKIKKHPLARAVRPDKFCLAGLNATLLHYLREEVEQKIPIWQMISKSSKEIYEIAFRWKEMIGFGKVESNRSTIGGGSLPEETLPTYVLSIPVRNPDKFLKELRGLEHPIIARIENDCILFDPRTVFDSQEKQIVDGIKSIFSQEINSE
ncbi:MAG: L-seryl-tRNA(Sec) selenium transferase [Chloroflexi bacterium HGW-Chloroflexi-8]|nr:MAG: L-seryl-tRNA(Sec) selenium transferase [Chloroflexi bacterium HGW-Chloroflexi-8]